MTAGLDMPKFSGPALCAQTDPDEFYPDKGGSSRAAKNICGRCDIRDECLQYALDNDERFGIWGGLSERERRRLRNPHQPTTTPTTPASAPPAPVITHRRWTDQELRTAVQALRGYGMTYGEMAQQLHTSITRVRAATRRTTT